MVKHPASVTLTTAAAVATLKPRPVRYAVKDSKIVGLEIRVRPDGIKTWTLRYRSAGEQRRLKLGEYPRLSLAKARKAAQGELRKVDGGLDPQVQRRAAKAAAEAAKQDSIDALITRYIKEWAKPRKRTWTKDQGRLTNEVLPKWKGRAVSSITRADVRALMAGIASRPAPILANRVLELVRKMFNFALSHDLITVNPAILITPAGVEKRNRPDTAEREEGAYTEDEVRRIWANLKTLSATTAGPIKLQLLTACRPAEAYDLTWDEIDGTWWTLPAARSKNRHAHRLPLTGLALDLLAKLPRLDDEPQAFAGARGNKQRTRDNTIIFAGVSPRLKPRHALRSTVSTGMAEAGVGTEDISRVLNHRVGKPQTAGYIDFAFDTQKRLALSKWARTLTAILEQKETAPKVVLLARRER